MVDPISPKQTPGIENGTWEVDWKLYGDQILDNIPQGVNMVNVFVGGFDASNKFQIDSRSDFDKVIPPSSRYYDPKNPKETYLQKFVEECHAKGIAVKMSLGGSGGWCGNTWDVLNSQGVQFCADTLVAFCKANHLDGVDFDFEEWNQPNQAALEQKVGALIKEVKNQDPSLQTSLCTNAGFATWKEHIQNILDASKDSSGHCGIDRLYIMSYYDPLQKEESAVGQWAKWLETTYHFSPSQISVGIDNVDSHAYDITEFAKWAKSQGYSTCYWAWAYNGNPASSNESTNAIWNIYHTVEKQ